MDAIYVPWITRIFGESEGRLLIATQVRLSGEKRDSDQKPFGKSSAEIVVTDLAFFSFTFSIAYSPIPPDPHNSPLKLLHGGSIYGHTETDRRESNQFPKVDGAAHIRRPQNGFAERHQARLGQPMLKLRKERRLEEIGFESRERAERVVVLAKNGKSQRDEIHPYMVMSAKMRVERQMERIPSRRNVVAPPENAQIAA